MHRAGCEEVNYNPAYGRGWEGKVAACTRSPRPVGPQPPLGAPGPPGVRGATRGLWVRPLAWGPCAPNTPLWPQIVPGLLARPLCFGTACCVWDLPPPVAGGVGVIVAPLVSS